jgi:lincosamide nucleotidyltransferase A/C/D/E
MMTGEDVLWVLDLLEQAGVRCWVDGGWGIDALLGEQTRDHDDLDIALEWQDLGRFEAAVAGEGFRETYRDGPCNPVFADVAGRRIDVHLVDTAVEITDERGGRVYGGRGLPYEVGALGGAGEILGRRVACCTAEFQVHSHTGYDFDEQDVRDLIALCDRFGVALPTEYQARDAS